MASFAHIVAVDGVSLEPPEKKQKLISEAPHEALIEGSEKEKQASDEETRKPLIEGSEKEKVDSSVCAVCRSYMDTLNAPFDWEDEPEVDSDDEELMGGVCVWLRGKIDLEGPRAKAWRKMADYSNLALEKYNKDNGTNYELVEVVKVNVSIISGFAYYITFTIKDAAAAGGVPKFFQATVMDMVNTGLEVGLCRLKPTNY